MTTISVMMRPQDLRHGARALTCSPWHANGHCDIILKFSFLVNQEYWVLCPFTDITYAEISGIDYT